MPHGVPNQQIWKFHSCHVTKGVKKHNLNITKGESKKHFTMGKSKFAHIAGG